MSEKLFISSLIAVANIFIGSCGNNHTRGDSSGGISQLDGFEYKYPVAFHHAKGLDFINGEKYEIVHLFHPDLPDYETTYFKQLTRQ